MLNFIRSEAFRKLTHSIGRILYLSEAQIVSSVREYIIKNGNIKDQEVIYIVENHNGFTNSRQSDISYAKMLEIMTLLLSAAVVLFIDLFFSRFFHTTIHRP